MSAVESPWWVQAAQHGDTDAIVDTAGPHSYAELVERSKRVALTLLDGAENLNGERIAFMVTPSFEHVSVQWGIWRAGGLAVPLCLTHPAIELAYVLDDAEPSIAIGGSEYAATLRPLAEKRGARWIDLADAAVRTAGHLPDVAPESQALMIYTSGTTGRPKGVITTHRAIGAQIASLVDAWEWSALDRTVLDLPLHHLHGILNVVSCALAAGATVEMHAKFNADATWGRLADGDVTMYMAVPTIYKRLIDHWESCPPAEQARLSTGVSKLRVMVSGSAALPVPTLEQWESVSGHVLLERYGMSEIGMALSNPLHGERVAGSVGFALPGVSVRLVDESKREVEDDRPGEIQVRGLTVFQEYWRRPEATRDAFTDDGWFVTGDIATRIDGRYRILGRSSVDILKSGGEKISALDIESVLLGHPDVDECAVVGLDDEAWGQRIVAVVVSSARPTAVELGEWCRERLAPFKIPKSIEFVDELPRNAMGKVVKGLVVALLED